ncbi:hypothetical protein BDQ17DRAFT_1327455 [Cyathus striatus]|nr:hypothetical protein BDQ17DRAFT_1327455 [Cyathus striatus]
MSPDFTSYPAHVTSTSPSRNIDAQPPSISERRLPPPKRLPFMSTHLLVLPARKAYERGRIVGGKRATVVDNVGVGGGMVDDEGLEVWREGAVVKGGRGAGFYVEWTWDDVEEPVYQSINKEAFNCASIETKWLLYGNWIHIAMPEKFYFFKYDGHVVPGVIVLRKDEDVHRDGVDSSVETSEVTVWKNPLIILHVCKK